MESKEIKAIILHEKALSVLTLIQRAKERQRICSENAAATYADYHERPMWAEFPSLVAKARYEAELAPKVVVRLQRYYNNILLKIAFTNYEKSIA
jgi:hypothetical protein